MLDAKTRVIECRDGIQWIIQHHRNGRGCNGWRGVSFCRTKEALLRLAGNHPDLLALPDSPDGSPVPAPPSRAPSSKPLPDGIVPDAKWPGMYRLRRPDGSLTEMVNLARAKDALQNV
jgi:hypothetical protein